MEFASWTEEQWFGFLETLFAEQEVAIINEEGQIEVEVVLSDGRTLSGYGDTLKEALLDFVVTFTEGEAGAAN